MSVFSEGCRVKFGAYWHAVSNYEIDLTGMTGTVVYVHKHEELGHVDEVDVQLDDLKYEEQLSEWNNCVCFYRNDDDDGVPNTISDLLRSEIVGWDEAFLRKREGT